MRCARALIVAAIGTVCATGDAHAQLSEFFKKILPANPISPTRQADPPATRPDSSSSQGDSTDAKFNSLRSNAATGTAAGNAGGKKRSGDIAPDRQCSKPQEKFNIFEKAVEYGGKEAEARLQRLITSDLRFENLTREDRALLKFIAQTTVWVPVEVEHRIVAIGGVFSGKGKGSTESLEMSREKVEGRVKRIKATLKDFPGDIRVAIDPAQPDGAYAKFGGDIVIAADFAEQMAEHPIGGDFVLAHELSHVYKRHPIKRLQFELVSTSEGWKLARKLLGRATGANDSNLLANASFIAVDMPKLYSVIKAMHLTFSREQELEADACTAIWLKAIGDDPAPAWKDFVAHYAAKDNHAKTAYGSTHPPTSERAQNFAAKLASGKSAGAANTATNKGAKTVATAPSTKP